MRRMVYFRVSRRQGELTVSGCGRPERAHARLDRERLEPDSPAHLWRLRGAARQHGAQATILNARHRSPTRRTVSRSCAHSSHYPHLFLDFTFAFLPATAESDGGTRSADDRRAQRGGSGGSGGGREGAAIRRGAETRAGAGLSGARSGPAETGGRTQRAAERSACAGCRGSERSEAADCSRSSRGEARPGSDVHPTGGGDRPQDFAIGAHPEEPTAERPGKRGPMTRAWPILRAGSVCGAWLFRAVAAFAGEQGEG